MTADDPWHDWGGAEPGDIIYVVVPVKESENGLANLPGKTVTIVLPPRRVSVSASPTISVSLIAPSSFR